MLSVGCVFFLSIVLNILGTNYPQCSERQIYTFCGLRTPDIRIKAPYRRNYCLCIMSKFMHHLDVLRGSYDATTVTSEQVVHHIRDSPAPNSHNSTV